MDTPLPAKHPVVLVSGISGLKFASICENIRIRGDNSGIRIGERLFVEDYMTGHATEYLKESEIKPPYTLTDVVRLPFRLLCSTVENATRTALQKCKEQIGKTSVLTFHPVLLHQKNRSFLSPYNAVHLSSAFEDAGCKLKAIVSIHDDIYDVHRRLLCDDQIFSPKLTRADSERRREPSRDIQELLTILEWRDRELSEARSLANALGVEHLLFHRKALVDTFLKVAVEGKPCVYLSHPIAQPRRDISGIVDVKKCKMPDSDRGYALIKEVQDLANAIGQCAAIVEPTCIDELRINNEPLEAATEEELENAALPYLRERWPIGGGYRMSGFLWPDSQEGFVRVEQGVFNDLEAKSAGSLSKYSSAIKMIAGEIKRQLTVRDHCLAEQAHLVVAYRPFSKPDSPELTGGVDKEIKDAKQRIVGRQPRCNPSLIIYNPPEDEARRRRNALNEEWPEIEIRYFKGNRADALVKLKDRFSVILERDALSPADDRETSEGIKAELEKALERSEAHVNPLSDDSSMASGELARRRSATKSLLSRLVDNGIMTSKLEKDASDESLKGAVKWIGEEISIGKFNDIVARTVAKGKAQADEGERGGGTRERV